MSVTLLDVTPIITAERQWSDYPVTGIDINPLWHRITAEDDDADSDDDDGEDDDDDDGLDDDVLPGEEPLTVEDDEFFDEDDFDDDFDDDFEEEYEELEADFEDADVEEKETGGEGDDESMEFADDDF